MSSQKEQKKQKASALTSKHNTEGVFSKEKEKMSKAEKEPAGKMQKRTFSEVSEASMEELSFIHQQLTSLQEEMKETKDGIKNLMTKDDIQSFISKTVKSVIQEMETKLILLVEKQVEEQLKEKTTELNNRLDYMVYENSEIKDKLDKMEKELQKERENTQYAIEKSNYNEQYSRKNNTKILGVRNMADETEDKLTEVVINMVKEKANVDLDPADIVAIHRIPSKHEPKPVLIKLRNTTVKTCLMRQRKVMKQQGNKLVDDVTRRNTELINRLLSHEKIESAWFFNGVIYGKTSDGRKHKFDLFSNINEVLKAKK